MVAKATELGRSVGRRTGWLGMAAFSVAALGLAGCAGASDDLGHQLSKMQTEVMTLRAQTAALTERLEAVEARPTVGVAAPTVAAEPASDPRPPLRVVHLGPDADAGPADAPYDTKVVEAPEGRVSIRSTPNGLVQEDADGTTSTRTKTATVIEKKSKPAASSTKPASSKPDAAKKN